MSILADHQIQQLNIMSPCHKKTIFRGMSHGLSSAGYDVRASLADAWNMGRDENLGRVMAPDGEGVVLNLGQSMLIGVTEHFTMPVNVVGIVHPKSTWTRRGLVIGNCVLEPGWRGYLSLLVMNHGGEDLTIIDGEPIAQVVFHTMDQQPQRTYDGKYQNAERGPQGPKFEKPS